MIQKPLRLSVGDTIGIVAPASAPPDPKAIDQSVEAIRKLGFRPKLARNVRSRLGFLAGTDRQRAEDLMKMFADPEVRAVLCVRGGYGSARLLPLLDFGIVRKHPKIFIGYSDITSLHSAFLKEAGLISFHGPMLNSDFIKPAMPAFTRDSFLRALTRAEPPGRISRGHKSKARILRRGVAEGRLVGGNISILCSTLATRWQPSFKGRILFFEDLDEAPYRFDRMLTQLLNAGLLQQVAGIAIGINANCADPKAGTSREYRQTCEDVFRDRLLPLKVPVVMDLPFGHVPINATLPVGARVRLDGNAGDLEVIESAVK